MGGLFSRLYEEQQKLGQPPIDRVQSGKPANYIDPNPPQRPKSWWQHDEAETRERERKKLVRIHDLVFGNAEAEVERQEAMDAANPLDVRCPKCESPYECKTPSGRKAAKIHKTRYLSARTKARSEKTFEQRARARESIEEYPDE